MPAPITHYFFADAVYKASGETVSQIAALYSDAYYWGAQGAKSLYYYHAPFTRNSSAAADKLYSSAPAELFEALCHSAINQHDSAALSYVFGFCTHYALERVTHSFIKARAKILSTVLPKYNLSASEKRVEQAIDTQILNKNFPVSPAGFDMQQILNPHASECIVISKVFSSAAKSALDLRLSPAMFYRSLQDMNRALNLAYGKSHLKMGSKFSVKLAEKSKYFASILSASEPIPIDVANHNHSAWISEDGTKRQDAFEDLFDAAVPLAISLQRAVLNRYYQQKPLDPRFFPTNFYGEKI